MAPSVCNLLVADVFGFAMNFCVLCKTRFGGMNPNDDVAVIFIYRSLNGEPFMSQSQAMGNGDIL